MMKLVVLSFAILAVAVAYSPNDQPQSVLAFVDVGAQLDEAFDLHLPAWEQLLNNIKLSDVETSGSGFDVHLRNLKLGSFKLGAVTTSGSPTGVLSFSVTGVSAVLTLDFKVVEQSWPHIGDSGNARATFSDGSLSGQINLSVGKGSLQLAVPSASCRLNNFNLDIHSSLSFLYDLLKGLIQGSIRDSAQSALADAIKSAIPDAANPFLATIPQSVPMKIGYGNITIAQLELDLAIQGVSGQAEDFLLTTSAMPKDVTEVCPFPAKSVSRATLKEGTIATVAVDEAILNCFAWDVYKQGHLNYLLTPENFKQDILPLNTTAWKAFAPTLAEKYPGMAMQIYAKASEIPQVSISAGPTVNVSLWTQLEVSVIDEKGTIIPAFVLAANFSGSANALQAHVENQYFINITASVASGGCVMSLVSSQVGDFDVTNLQATVDFATKIGLSYVQSILYAGWSVKVPLPPPLVMTVAGIDADAGYLRVYAATAPSVAHLLEEIVV